MQERVKFGNEVKKLSPFHAAVWAKIFVVESQSSIWLKPSSADLKLSKDEAFKKSEIAIPAQDFCQR